MPSDVKTRGSTFSKFSKLFTGDPSKQPTTTTAILNNDEPPQSAQAQAHISSYSSSRASSLESLSSDDIIKKPPAVPILQQRSSSSISSQLPSRVPSQKQQKQHKTPKTLSGDKISMLGSANASVTQLSRSSSSASHQQSHNGGSSGNGNGNGSVLSTASGATASIAPSSSNSANSSIPKQQPRFIVFEDGTHQHHLKNAKRQEKLSSMFKNLLTANKKLRDGAVSAVPDILNNNNTGGPPSLFSGLLINQQQGASAAENYPFSGATRVPGHKNDNIASNMGNAVSVNSTADSNNSNNNANNQTFVERYGRCQEVVGKGTFGVVRISHKKVKNSEAEKLFAVKEFKRKPNEDPLTYSKRLTSEFCISASLKHVNIIETLDLLQDAKGDYVEVMEFCSGGDLYTLIIATGKLEYLEADCFFKQLIRGVNYMHEMGITHRDLKPENLLLTSNGCLKITDFGNGECFKMAWETHIHLSNGICGSSPYIAPEEYVTKEFDPRLVDIWSCGVIYMAMRTGRHLWKQANAEDEFYQKYLEDRKSSSGYEPIELIKRARCRNVIYSILDPIPSRRINGKQILNSEWGREIKCCVN